MPMVCALAKPPAERRSVRCAKRSECSVCGSREGIGRRQSRSRAVLWSLATPQPLPNRASFHLALLLSASLCCAMIGILGSRRGQISGTGRAGAFRCEPQDSRHTFLQRFQESREGAEPPAFLAVEDAYERAEAYYETMKRNIMAEAVSSFRAAGAGARVLDARPAQAGLLVTKLINGQDGDLRASGAADLQLKDYVVEFDEELFWVTKCEVSSAQVPGGTKYTAELEGFSSSGRELRYPEDFRFYSDIILKL